jgi:hypothetical protein
LRILNTDATRLDAADAPGAVAEQKNVSGEALDGEILIDGADEGLGRLFDDIVIGRIGNSAAAGDGRQSCPTPSMDAAMDPIPMDQGSAAAASRANPFRQDVQDGLEIVAT